MITWWNVELHRGLVSLPADALALVALVLDEDPRAVAVGARGAGRHVPSPHCLLARALGQRQVSPCHHLQTVTM